MIQKEKAEATHRWIRMAERGHLHRSDRHPLAKTPSAFLRERTPSMDEVSGKFEVGSRHCAQSRTDGT